MLSLVIAASEHLFFSRRVTKERRCKQNDDASKSTDQRFDELPHEMIPEEWPVFGRRNVLMKTRSRVVAHEPQKH